MVLKELLPSPPLSAYIRRYRIVQFEFPDNILPPSKVYPPRPEHCLQFFPTPGRLVYPHSATTVKPKNALLFGMHTVVSDREIAQKLLVFQVVFQPGVLFRLLGIPQHLWRNGAIEASDVMGTEVDDVNEQLFLASTHDDMVRTVEKFLMALVKKIRKDHHPIDDAMRGMFACSDHRALDWFIDRSCLSHRQFDRKFLERTGVTAKEFMRVIRFYKAYLLKNRFPQHDWLTIALQCGYYDYQHLARDYKEFTSYSPARFFALDSPERALGGEEVY